MLEAKVAPHVRGSVRGVQMKNGLVALKPPSQFSRATPKYAFAQTPGPANAQAGVQMKQVGVMPLAKTPVPTAHVQASLNAVQMKTIRPIIAPPNRNRPFRSGAILQKSGVAQHVQAVMQTKPALVPPANSSNIIITRKADAAGTVQPRIPIPARAPSTIHSQIPFAGTNSPFRRSVQRQIPTRDTTGIAVPQGAMLWAEAAQMSRKAVLDGPADAADCFRRPIVPPPVTGWPASGAAQPFGWFGIVGAGLAAAYGLYRYYNRGQRPLFEADGLFFDQPKNHDFCANSALKATTSLVHGQMRKLTGKMANSGVKIGDVASYGAIRFLEKTGDGLTGDHQPSGAAIKEAIRIKLHSALNQVLTRGMAKNAYLKAITIVMSDAWHKASSRTYGGRNTPARIASDAADLLTASMEDWKKTVPELKKRGFSILDIEAVWKKLCDLRESFFQTGDPQFQ